MSDLFCFGLGYSARAIAVRQSLAGWHVSGTARTASRAAGDQSPETLFFDGLTPGPAVRAALQRATHLLVSVPPDGEGDPVLRHHRADLATAPRLRWIGYLSTIGVYGDRGGDWVDETAAPEPTSDRSRRRMEAEQSWLDHGRETGVPAKIFRLSGIYGPGRSAIDSLRDGSARCIIKPGQVFNRIHVADIAETALASMAGRGTHAIYNVTDDEPAPPQDVIAYGAQLLGLPRPREVAFDAAELSPMARTFYGENKRVRNARIKSDLGVTLKYPTYREGLAAISALTR